MSKYDVKPEFDTWRSIVIDGVEFRYRLENDLDTSIFDDGDWFGELMWMRRTNDYGHPWRPDHFDGNAEIIERDNGSCLWWQPPMDFEAKRGTPEFDAFRAQILELLQHGYVGVIVETDQHSESLWGIGSFDDEGQAYACCEMIDEIRRDIERTSADVERWISVGAAT